MSHRAAGNVVAIFGTPRSGTSWLGQIFNSSPRVIFRFQPLFSYEFKDRLSDQSSSEQINKFYEDLINAESEFVLQRKNVSGKKSPEFTKHDKDTLVWKEVRYINILDNLVKKSNTKLVLLVRHPGAVINSWLQAPKEFNNGWDPLSEWRHAENKNQNKPEEFNGFEKWKEATELFLKLEKSYPDRVFVVRYEDLNNNTVDTVRKLFDFAGLELNAQTREFISVSKSSDDHDPYGVFRQTQDSEKWKTQLNKEIADEITSDLKSFPPAKELGYV